MPSLDGLKLKLSFVYRFWIILLPLLTACYKQSDDVCVEGEQERGTNISYQAHWPASLTVESNWSDTTFLYYVGPVELVDEILPGESMTYDIPQFRDFQVFVPVEDSLQAQVDSTVSVVMTFNCPE